MKVALCCIGRLENRYAVEYVEWYKKLGFDKIFIYDNNHDGEEHFEEVLQSFIDDEFVEVIDFRNREAAQLQAYTDCYQKHGDEYDWIAFFDFDEFLTLIKNRKIKPFLKQFKKFDSIKINWMIYTDNDLVLDDGRPCLERFTTPMQYDKCVAYEFPENYHVKSIIKGGFKNIKWLNPHVCRNNLKYCNAVGVCVDDSPFQLYDYSIAYLKHFTTKTIDEFISKKMVRGLGDRTRESFEKTYNSDNFFIINNKTEEKENFVSGLQNVDIFICTHKKFNNPLNSKCYKVLDNHDFDKSKSILDDKFYSEIYSFNELVTRKYNFKKYVGFCHYRRYFSFLDDIPDLDKIFNNYDAIVAAPLQLKVTVKEQYSLFHNIEDLYIIGGIIADKYTDYAKMFHNFLKGNIFIPYNMFIMKKEDFLEYISFVMNVLDEYIKIVGTDIEKRIKHNKDKYLKLDYPNNTVKYQYRIGGYLAERLTNIFILTHFKKLKTYNVIITEDKYKNDKKV